MFQIWLTIFLVWQQGHQATLILIISKHMKVEHCWGRIRIQNKLQMIQAQEDYQARYLLITISQHSFLIFKILGALLDLQQVPVFQTTKKYWYPYLLEKVCPEKESATASIQIILELDSWASNVLAHQGFPHVFRGLTIQIFCGSTWKERDCLTAPASSGLL